MDNSLTRRITRVLFGTLICFVSQPLAAAEPATQACQGEFVVQLSSHPVDKASSSDNALWFQGYVKLEGALLACSPQLVIHAKNGWKEPIVGPQGAVASSLLDGQRKSLHRDQQGNFILPLQGRKRSEFWVHIPQGKVLLSGLYQSDFEFKVKAAGNEFGRAVSLNYQVKPFVRARVESRQGAHVSVSGTNVSIDMGNLTEKNQRQLDVIVVSNGSVKLELDSRNQGDMVNVKNARYKIPYATSLNGQPLRLNAPHYLRPHQQRETRFRLQFENTPMPSAREGRYEDEMTIMLTAF
ncbi:hypothetical protein ACXHQJ_07245 [Vibrio vulnificus]